MSADVIYIEDVAKRLGKTETAVRALFHRDSKLGSRKKTLPPAIRIGRRIAWRVADFDAWLAAKAGAKLPSSTGKGGGG